MTEPAAAAQARPSPTPLRGWPQRLLHLAALIVGWGLFFWGWHDVAGQTWDSTALKWLIIGSLVVLPLITVAWVLHNVGIHRRKGPRTKLRTVDETYRHDWNGREIVADLAAIARANIVIIDIEGDRKVYRPAGASPVQWVLVPAQRDGVGNRAADEEAAEAAGARAA